MPSLREDAPEVSVVVPTYNRWPLLGEAIDSVLAQTFADLELLVVDDGSTDETESAVRALPDPRVRYVRIPHCANHGQVRNVGIRAARGRWVAFLDSDDYWHADLLERQLAALEATSAAWGYSGYRIVDPDGREVRSFPGPTVPCRVEELPLAIVTDRVSVTIVTMIVDRRVLLELGGMSEAPMMFPDRDLQLRLAERFLAAPVTDLLASVLEHPGRGNRTTEDNYLRSANPLRALLQRNPPPALRRAARRVLATHLTASARIELERGDRREARAKLRECAWPGMLKARWWWLAGRALIFG